MGEKRRIARAAGLMSAATFISRVLGYARDMLFAFHFGASGLSDTFFVAFRIPNLLRELFAEGSMSSAVIPVMTEYGAKDPGEARRLLRVAFTFIVAVVGALTVAGVIFAPAIVTLIAPGFLRDPEKFSTTVLLTRVMFPFLLFVSLAALSMGALNVRRVFFVPALAPAALNVVTIAVLVLLAARASTPVLAAAVGVLLGGAAQFLFQAPALARQGYSLRPDFSFRHPGLRQIGRLVLPMTLGMAVSQINLVVTNILASFLPGGSITYLFYSMRLIQFPIGVFGVAMGMAALPSLSEHAVRRDMESLREDFSFALRLLLFVCVPAMAGLIALREPIINLLFQRGLFDYSATRGTAEALLFYSLGIWAVVGVRIVAATFYSMQDTRTPVRVAAVALTVNVLASLALMGPMRHSGLALAHAISSTTNFLLLFYFLRRKLARVDARKILRSLARIAAASALMGLFAGWLLQGEMWTEPGRSLLKAGRLAGAIALSSGLYFALALAMRAEEAGFVINLLRERLQRRRK
ncbi:MAG: murein biosynthesis integral membrane protein MurJ [Thermodesulfovibrionales bacterium]